MRRDWITGLILIALALVYYKMAEALPRSLLSDEVGAEGFPKLLAISLFLLSTFLMLTGFLKRQSGAAAEVREKGKTEKQAALKAGGMLLLGIGYLLSISWIGYPLAAGLLIASVLLYQKETLSLKVILTAGIGGIFFWLFFVFALKIPMPMGIWTQLLTGGASP